MLTTYCLQAVVAVVASRWRYIWPRRGSCWFWCATSGRPHGHRYRQPAAGSDTCLSSGRVWCRTSPADKRCTPVQQYSKLQKVHLCNSATSFQRLSHARCSHVQKAFRDWVMLDVHLYKLSDWLMLYIHMYNQLSDWAMLDVYQYSSATSFQRWSHAPDVHLYNKFSDWVMLQMYTCTTSFQRLGHARRTPVQQCNKLPETESC